ncbi:MAG: quinone-dependent dihydroorotate dehydrogenase, partial [Gammaproteobacteria bacterium]|nr:quinone-dependent dihydroorotate dehydrogenase [Gammaproteobacteria bacterium]
AHDWIIRLMWLVGKIPPLRNIVESSYRTSYNAPLAVAGLQFKNPIGLAAGFDKDAHGWKGLAALGFGHIELGTITLKPQR